LHSDNRAKNVLASRIAAGDGKAYAEFVDVFGPRIQAMARRFALGCDVDDLIQEIFLDLYRSIGGFRGESALSTWVYRVAYNHCLKSRERRAIEHEGLDGAEYAAGIAAVDPQRCAQRSELKDHVEAALEDLSPEHRDVVVLHELNEMTYSECAAVLKVPEGTVKSRLHYAFRQLRGSLAAYVLGDDPATGEASFLGKGAASEPI